MQVVVLAALQAVAMPGTEAEVAMEAAEAMAGALEMAAGAVMEVAALEMAVAVMVAEAEDKRLPNVKKGA